MKKFRLIVAAGLCIVFQSAIAGDFPEGGISLTPEALSSSVSGKVFSVKPEQGPTWRWQFNADGYFTIKVGNLNDSGKWSTKESALCTEGRYIKFSCNEVRTVGGELYLKRDSGEIVKLVVQSP